MTKVRTPLTIAHAVTKIAGLIGHDAAGEVCRCKARLIYAWSDPECRKRPTLEQSIALDVAYRVAGGEGAPIHEAYAELVGLHVRQITADCRALRAEIGDAARETGEAIGCSLDVVDGNASPIVIHRALSQAEEARAATTALVRRLKSFLPFGAGPIAGIIGGTHD